MNTYITVYNEMALKKNTKCLTNRLKRLFVNTNGLLPSIKLKLEAPKASKICPNGKKSPNRVTLVCTSKFEFESRRRNSVTRLDVLLQFGRLSSY